MPKITFVGAGSTVFAKNLMGDILSFPELAGSTLTLFDINPDRLSTSEIVAHKVAGALGAKPKIETTTDRRAALDGADYAISMIQVAGYKPGTVIDFEIPKRYGLRATIADTLGVGGIMRGLRTIPVMLELCGDMQELCPDVTFLNYVNPMAMITWAILKATPIKTVGLCHSVQGTAMQLAMDIGVPFNEIQYIAAGINHMAFYLRFERNGEDLYPLLRQVIQEGRVPDWNRVRYEMLTRLGYFVTEFERAFFGICALVHQARSARSDRAFQHPAGRIYPALREPDRGLGGDADRVRGPGQIDQGRAQPRVRLADHSRHRDGRAGGDLRQCVESRFDRQSAAGLLRGGAVPGG